MVFDLDPGEGVTWRDVREAGQAVRAALAEAGLTAFAKTSGKKGLHVVVPVTRRTGWKEFHKLSGEIAVAIARRHAGTFVTSMAKTDRKRRIFLDFHRNARSATSVGAYSLRAVRGLPASTPVAWADLDSIDAPEDLNYATVPGFLTKSGDPWADIDAHAAPLGKDVATKISG
jgi:DNA ligase D-like protein (predicted polymerase)